MHNISEVHVLFDGARGGYAISVEHLPTGNTLPITLHFHADNLAEVEGVLAAIRKAPSLTMTKERTADILRHVAGHSALPSDVSVVEMAIIADLVDGPSGETVLTSLGEMELDEYLGCP